MDWSETLRCSLWGTVSVVIMFILVFFDNATVNRDRRRLMRRRLTSCSRVEGGTKVPARLSDTGSVALVGGFSHAPSGGAAQLTEQGFTNRCEGLIILAMQ